MKTEQQIEFEEGFFEKVKFEVWRRGGNEDVVSKYDILNDYRKGLTAPESALKPLKIQNNNQLCI